MVQPVGFTGDGVVIYSGDDGDSLCLQTFRYGTGAAVDVDCSEF